MDTYIFELAVYRMPPEPWEADAKARVDRYAESLLASWQEQDTEPRAAERLRADRFARYVERPYGWQYNEVVGWIRLRWDGPGPVVKGYLWQVGRKTLDGGEPRRRYRRGFTPFPFVGGEPLDKVVEEWFRADQADLAIYEQLRSGVLGVVSPKGELARRYIDLRTFDFVGPLIRWRVLLGLDDP